MKKFEIIEVPYNYAFEMNCEKRAINVIDRLIIHHSAIQRSADTSPLAIHSAHLMRGYSGIGYHFYIKADGTIYRGRPLCYIGAHCKGYNSKSIGICFEGNFEIEKPTNAQKIAWQNLVDYLRKEIPTIKYFNYHKELFATACPGKNCTFTELNNIKWEDEKKMFTDIKNACEYLKSRVGLEQSTIDFLLCYKYGDNLILKLANSYQN